MDYESDDLDHLYHFLCLVIFQFQVQLQVQITRQGNGGGFPVASIWSVRLNLSICPIRYIESHSAKIEKDVSIHVIQSTYEISNVKAIGGGLGSKKQVGLI